MLTLIFKAIVLYLVSWGVWRFLRQYVVKTELDNIPGPQSNSFWKGNFRQLFHVNAWDFHKEIAKKYGSVIRIKALLGENQLYIFDPRALHHIVVKDQYTFEETSSFIDGNRVIFGNGLLATLGEQHRKQRKMLNPVFSIVHMRQMIPIFYTVVSKLHGTFVQKLQHGPQEIDVLHWMTRTALELIGQSGLGYSFDSLQENSIPHPYSVSAKMLVPVNLRLVFARNYFLPIAVKLGFPRLQRFIIDILPWKDLRTLRDIVDILHKTSVEIIDSKKKALSEGEEAVLKQVGQGKDIISILMRANMEASEEDRLSEAELVGQITTLTFAAMDTTSGALSRILSQLANHPEVQNKLREEIVNALGANNQELSYDQLVSLPYLDAVCRETLRLFPPVSTLQRTTRKDVILPFSNPVKGVDGREITEVLIPNNTNVIISVICANRNPDIWGPDAEEWKPERWLSPLPDTIVDAHMPGIYSHLMTFLGGGRACIGFKFSQLEMKVVLSALLKSFHFSPSEKDIFWQMTGIASPTVSGSNGRPQLPLKVQLV